ncbi:MAG: energy-coupling factor transporter transmembrane protein EcfT [Anaerolineales bacterium]|nr:energy-coupling factor transporter transmembrane protein EcfT [Anaerolineales bacterium]
MHDRITFFVDVESPLHRLNPLTKLMLVFTIILLAFLSPWYFLPTGLFFLVIIPLSFWGRIGKVFLESVVRLLLPIFGFLFVMQAFFYPGGQTEIFHIWKLAVTTEGVHAAYLIVTRILAMVSSFLLLLLSTHPSILMSDLTRRGFPGSLSYIITSSLQILPQMRNKAASIIDAQRSRGLETEGALKDRIRALVPLVRPLVFGSLVDVEERTIAIEARGFTTACVKTSLLDILDPRVEKAARWLMVLILVAVIGSRLWVS